MFFLYWVEYWWLSLLLSSSSSSSSSWLLLFEGTVLFHNAEYFVLKHLNCYCNPEAPTAKNRMVKWYCGFHIDYSAARCQSDFRGMPRLYMMTSSNGTFSALLAHWPATKVIGEFPSQRSVTRSFDALFDVRLNKRCRKQSRRWWFETPLRSLCHHCNINRDLVA